MATTSLVHPRYVPASMNMPMIAACHLSHAKELRPVRCQILACCLLPVSDWYRLQEACLQPDCCQLEASVDHDKCESEDAKVCDQ